MTALVFPVVGRRMDHAEVGGRRVVEQLGDRVVGVGIGVGAAMRVGVGSLVDEWRERVGRLIGERIGTGRVEPLVSGVGAAERDRAVVGAGLVVVAVAREHHVDDGLEARIQEDVEGPIGVGFELGGDLVRGSYRRSHPRSVPSASVGREV